MYKTIRKQNHSWIYLIAPGLFMMMPFRVLYAQSGERGFGFENSATERLQAISVQVRVEGKLSCSSGDPDTGKNCILTILDNQTGKTYRIVGETGTTMKMFQAGTKNVALEGVLGDDQTLAVKTTQAL